MDILYVSILTRENITFQNKVALKIKSGENFLNVAQEFFNEVCKVDGLVPSFFHFEMFIKDNDCFYKLVPTSK